MKLVDRLVELSGREQSTQEKRIAKILPIFVFFFLFPSILFLIPTVMLDRWFHLSPLPFPTVRSIVAPLLIFLGIGFLLWTIKAQRELGNGSPMPLMATRQLVIQKPYAYCRNPLAFGLLAFYFGISLLLASVSSLLAVALFAAIILSYIKFIEERELEKRYGEPYSAYKAKTSFLIPRKRNKTSD